MAKGRRGRTSRKRKLKPRVEGEVQSSADENQVVKEEAAAKPEFQAVEAEQETKLIRADKPVKPAKLAKQAKRTEPENPGISTRIREYLLSLKYEWLKITFPSRKELVQSTVVVFLFTVVLMAIISLYDMAMTLFFSRVILPPTSSG